MDSFRNTESTGEGSRKPKHKGMRKGLRAAHFQLLPDGGEVDNNEENYEETNVAVVNQNQGQGVK